MTAMLDEEFMQSSITENDPHPSYYYYEDVSDLRADQYHCQTSLQQHICSSYCLKGQKLNRKDIGVTRLVPLKKLLVKETLQVIQLYRLQL